MFVMMAVMTPGDSSPTRVAAQVVTGVGFLGGGVILREGSSVRGLNTAATLWCAAAVGTLIGSGLLFQAYVGSMAVVGANLLLRPLVHVVQQLNGESETEKKSETHYRCRAICHREDEVNVRALLLHLVKEQKLMLRSVYSKNIDSLHLDNEALVELKVDVVTAGRNDIFLEQVVSLIKSKARVIAVSWEFVSQDTQ